MASNLEPTSTTSASLDTLVDLTRTNVSPDDRNGLLWLKTDATGAKVTSIQAYDGADWVPICTSNSGLMADAPTIVERGELYFATDEGPGGVGELKVYDGSVWVKAVTYPLPTASDTVLGGVKVPANSRISIDSNGFLQIPTPRVHYLGDAVAGYQLNASNAALDSIVGNWQTLTYPSGIPTDAVGVLVWVRFYIKSNTSQGSTAGDYRMDIRKVSSEVGAVPQFTAAWAAATDDDQHDVIVANTHLELPYHSDRNFEALIQTGLSPGATGATDAPRLCQVTIEGYRQ